MLASQENVSKKNDNLNQNNEYNDEIQDYDYKSQSSGNNWSNDGQWHGAQKQDDGQWHGARNQDDGQWHGNRYRKLLLTHFKERNIETLIRKRKFPV